MAVSLAGHESKHYQTACIVARKLVELLRREPLPADTILNVNVPDLPWEEIAGFEVTRLGHRHKAEPMIEDKDPRGRRIFWVGPPGGKRVSITPLQVDLTCYTALDGLARWVEKLQ